MAEPPPTEIRSTLGFLLHDASRLMRRRFVQRARMQRLALNRSEAAVLLSVAFEPGISQRRLATELDIEPISVVRLLDALERSTLIERRPHPTDRRVNTLFVTGAGAAMVERIGAIAEEVRDEALAGFPGEKREALIDWLLQIRANLAAAARREHATPPAEPARDRSRRPAKYRDEAR